MKNKWSPKKVRNIQEWLIDRWPDLFAQRPDQLPLSLSIHKEILKHRAENPELSCRLLGEALKRHVTSYGYLYGMQKNAHRVDLEGNRVDTVSAEHRHWAKSTLRAKQKLAQKVRKDKYGTTRPKLNRKPIKRPAAVVAPEEGKAASKRAAPVIRYKASRKKLINREVDLAS